MRRFLVCIMLLLGGMTAAGQIYTGGKGDGATMSCVPPVVQTLSATEIVCVSDTIVLAIHASGTNLQYKWQKKGANFFMDLTDADHYLGLGTDTLRILNPTSATDSGWYRCLVVNSCDSDTSETFHIDLNRAPWLTNRLAEHEYLQYVCVNSGSVQLISSFASERNDLRYAWKRIDTLSGNTTMLPDTTEVLDIDLAGNSKEKEGLYVVSAYNACGMVSDSVFLPIYEMPRVVWENPIVNGVLSTCKYERLELKATISGGGSYLFELQKIVRNPMTDEWEVLESVTPPSAYVSYVAVQTSQAGYYRWAVLNQCSADYSYSDVIELRVEEKPNFIFPADEVYVFPDTTVCEGSSLEMMCKASGSATKYYWTKNGERIEGADTNVLRLEDIQEGDAGNYFCIAYNNCVEKVSSRPIKVKVDLKPRFERDPFLKKRACVGDSITYFGVQADATADSVRWFLNRQPLYDNGHYENCNSEDFDILHIDEPDLGLYQVKAYNRCGGNLSEVLHLEKLSIPVSFKKGVNGYNMLLCAGMEQKLSVTTKGTTPIHYRWILNEHIYESDTNFVTVGGQDITEKNKYTVYAYNSCNTAVDTGWVNVEVFDHYQFTGEGEYCAGHQPTGKLKLAGSADTLEYSLYRDYGIFVEKRQGTGAPLEFENMPGGIYYITATNPKTECVQEMNGRPYVDEWPAPKAPNFFISSYFCMGNSGATLVLGEWERDVVYRLQRNQGSGFVNVPYTTFTGGVGIFSDPELNSPPDGEPKIYEGMDYGRYRVEATGTNGCTTTITLEDSVYMLEPPSRHRLGAAHGDTVNCNIPLSDGTIYTEFTELEVDRFMEGATYTLYKNGLPDTAAHQPDRTSPIGWSHIDDGEYYVLVETREGCTGTTNKVRIRNVDAPKQQTLSASGSMCADLDTDGDTKTLTVDATENGITYEIYRQDPPKLWYTFVGDGNPKDIIIPNQKATFYAKAIDPTGMCTTAFEKDITVKASNFQVATNPADVYLDAKGLTTWLHVDITGNYVQPLQVKWEDEAQLQQTGVISLPNTTYHKQYYWPFCPCADKHDHWGGDWVHQYSHGPQCTLTNCPYLYHAYKPAEHGCVYQGTEYNTWEWGGRIPWYDLYYCRDQITDEAGQEYYENDENNPFRNRLTTPVNEDRTYTVTVTDGAGCTHSDEVTVRVIGGKLRADILFSKVHKHYEYPFCPCAGQHHGTHYCGRGCNEDNCIRQYHAHRHEGCIKRDTKYTEYRGSYIKFYDLYYCCTNIRAIDTIVYKNDELFFCSEAKGGDLVYDKNWSFDSPGYADASWGGLKGDTVMFTAKQSGWLRLRVTSMGQEVRDSIWIDVYRRPFTAYIQDAGGQDRIDSLYLCKGEETKLYAYTAGGDGEVTTTEWWGDGFTGPNTGWWMFTPERSGWFYLTARNDDVVITDSVYILLRESPGTPEVLDPGVRCVQAGQSETIKVLSPTTAGVNYVLEYSIDNGGNFVEKDRYNNSAGGAIPFRVEAPVRDAGVYRVKAESMSGDHQCSTYSEPIEFVTPPSHDDITSLKYCDGEQLVLQLNSTSEDMSYSILSNQNVSFETIHAPTDYFHRQFGAGTYKFVYTRNGHYPFENGLTGSCSDTIDIEIRKVIPPNQVDVVVNGGAGACEGLNANISLSPTEEDVNYYLLAPGGERTELFQGNGGVAETVLSARPYGLYQVMAEREGCPTLVNYFVFNRNPQPVAQEDIYYCYPYGQLVLGEGVELKYDDLEENTEYILRRDGLNIDTVEGPGMKSFPGVKNGRYDIVAIDKETHCFSTVSFEVKAKEAPKAFTLYADCERNRNITLTYSEPGVRYSLYRDHDTLVAELDGTGDQLAFGVFNTTGVYTAVGEDTVTHCTADMSGSVQITELDSCKLIQKKPICTRTGVTDLIYPCSSVGWSYFLRDVTTTDSLMSDVIAGTGGSISWSSVGPHMIKPVVQGLKVKPSRYILYGRDVCGDIPLDVIEVGLAAQASGILAMENVTSSSGMPEESCINELENLYLQSGKAGTDYVLIGLTDHGYRDTLTTYRPETNMVAGDRYLLGQYKAYDAYVLAMDRGGCPNEAIIEMKYKPMPVITALEGESLCGGTGELNITLDGKLANQNYYLYINSSPVAVDTLLPADGPQFKPQTEPGRYWVIAENIDPISGARFCRDSMNETFAIGQSPTAFDIHRYPELDGGNIYLCIGDTAIISLGQSEPTVDYALCKDGVEVPGQVRQHRIDGGEITFAVWESGVYTVRGFLGACEKEMNNTVTVYADSLPHLQLYDTYYYCKGAEEGARIEVLGAPYLCSFELRDGGLGTEAIERDTVRFYLGDGISDTISFNHLCPAGEQYAYVLTYQTRHGCRGHHPFNVEAVDPPLAYKAISTGDAVCEAECTLFAILGDQNNVEYTLMKTDPAGDYEYNDNYIVGWGDRDTLWFPYAVCERGDFYINATYYTRPQCTTRLKINGRDTVFLAEVDTIRECSFDNYNVHYCANTALGGTITLQNAQEGIRYYLCKDGMTISQVGEHLVKTCTYEGETLTWTNVEADEICQRGDGVSTLYRVMAENTHTRCTKWMDAPVLVTADNSVEVDATTYPYYEFCEGEGVLLKARAKGCGLHYEWFRVGQSGQIAVGQDADLSTGLSGNYYCKISNACGSAATQPDIVLAVKDLTTKSPMGIRTLCEGSPDIIFSEFTGVNDGDYIWYRADKPDTVLSTRPWLEFGNVKFEDQGYYVCVGGSVQKGYCNILIDTVFVKVANHVDSAQVQLKYDTICSGTNKSLAANLTGYGIQWYFNGNAIPGATSGAYNRTFQVADAGRYAVKISSGCGERDLIPVYDIAVDTAIEHVWHTEDQYLCTPEALFLSIRTSPRNGVKYQWEQQIDGQPSLRVGDSADITVRVPEGVSRVTYRVYYYNTCNDYLSANYQDVEVNVATNIQATTVWPEELTFCEGSGGNSADRTLTATMVGTNVYEYLWIFNPAGTSETDTVARGAGVNTYTIPDDYTKSGLYTCEMVTDCGRIKYPYSCWVRINTPASIVTDLAATAGKMCEGSIYTPSITATGSDLQFRWILYHKDGTVDTVGRGIGYEWQDSHVLDLPTEERYAGDTLRCKVYNGCGEDMSTEVILQIEGRRTINVEPENWVCSDSLATVHITLLDSHGVPYSAGPWEYKLCREDYNPILRQIGAGFSIDTVKNLYPGEYAVRGLKDGVCNYAGQDMAVFTVKERSKATATMSMPAGKRDTTLCGGENLPLYVRVEGGNGPFEVTIWHKKTGETDWVIYNEWINVNPYYIDAADAHSGYEYNIPVYHAAQFKVTVRDLNGGGSEEDICDAFVSPDQLIKVKVEVGTQVQWGMPIGETGYGECQLPVNLKTVLNPTPPEGIFHVTRLHPGNTPAEEFDRDWTAPYILQTDGPGMYAVSYSTGGVCDNHSMYTINFMIDSLPTARLFPTDTIICSGNALPMVYAQLQGAAPFKYMRVESSRLKRNGDVEPFSSPGWECGEPVGTTISYPRQAIPFSFSGNDSIVRYVLKELKDFHNCPMAGGTEISATIGIAQLPELKVEGLHPAYNHGYWDGMTKEYNLPEDDSVQFRLTLAGGKAPWVFRVYQGTTYPITGAAVAEYTVYGKDTLYMGRQEGYYLFACEDAYHCPDPNLDHTKRQIRYAPSGYLTITGLYLGGAIRPELRGGPLNQSVLMKSELMNLSLLDLHEMDPYGITIYGSQFIDWVYVEARQQDAHGEWHVRAKDSCMLLNDGTTIARTGTTAIELRGCGTQGDLYHIAVFHRNHLPVMTKNAVQLGASSSTPVGVTFRYEGNFWTEDGVLSRHAWVIGTQYGTNIWGMAPSYRQINKLGELVSMSNPNAAIFNAGNYTGGNTGMLIYDVNLDGKVDFPPYNASLQNLNSYGDYQDAWLLYLNRDRFSEIKALP